MGNTAPPRRAVTRADVARYAQVSTAVVSYVLNSGPKPVAPATRRRVLEAIDVLGYRPNATAQALSRGRSDVIGMIVSDSCNPYFAQLVLAFDVAAQSIGKQLIVMNRYAWRAADTDPVRVLAGQQVDGMIVASALNEAEQKALATLAAPTVLVDQFAPTPTVTTIGSDYYTGARLGVEHLITAHGHERIAFIGGMLTSDLRVTGWIDAMTSTGLPLGPRYLGEFGTPHGYASGLAVARSTPRPSAIFAASDQLALAAMNAVHASGLRVPEDIAIVGFDGIADAAYAWPSLTTVSQPMAAIATHAVQVLTSGATEPQHHSYEPELVVRRSCGCPAGAG